MKLCTFIINGEQRAGIWTETGIVDTASLGFPPGMNAVIERGAEALRAALDGYGGERLDEKTLCFGNITRPQKIVCAGLNYIDHARETGGEPPEYPVLFSKFADTLTPSGEAVTLPSWQRSYDYEAELVAVVGRAAYNIGEAEADNHIFGYACGNDLSARDSQFLSNQWLIGKNFPGFAPAGPYIVTRDEFDPEAGRGIRCFVNGERVQNGNTADMIFTCRRLFAAASRHFTLSPGDLIFTGTPAGVILGKPKGERRWLVPGDTVRVEIDGLGELTTPLV